MRPFNEVRMPAHRHQKNIMSITLLKRVVSSMSCFSSDDAPVSSLYILFC